LHFGINTGLVIAGDIGAQTNIAGDAPPGAFGVVQRPGCNRLRRGGRYARVAGAVYKPTAPIKQHFGDCIDVRGDGNIIGNGNTN